MNFTLRIKGEHLYIGTTYWRRVICLILGIVIVSSMTLETPAVLSFILLLLSVFGAGYGEQWLFDRKMGSIRHSIIFFVCIKKKDYKIADVQAVGYKDMKVGAARRRFFRYGLLLNDARTVTIEVRKVREDEPLIPKELANFLAVPCKPS